MFASLVDDPSAHPEKFPTEEAQEAERQGLFRIIEELIKWENSNNDRVLQAVRNEILRSCDGKPPPVYDPFCCDRSSRWRRSGSDSKHTPAI